MSLLGKIKTLLANQEETQALEEFDPYSPEQLDQPPDYTFVKALHAVAKGDTACIVDYLNLNPAYALCRDWEEHSLLHQAALFARLDIIELLLQQAINVNACYQDNSALHLAISTDNHWIQNHKPGQKKQHQQDQYQTIKRLLTHGASLKQVNERGENALHIAARLGHEHLLSLFLEHGAEIDQLTQNKAEGAQSNQQGRSALLLVARHNKRFKLMDWLIQQGANPNVQDDIPGYTPLHYIAACPLIKNNDPQQANKENSLAKITQLLLKYKAAPNIAAPLKQHKTPLHLAAANNHVAMAEILLQHGADANVRADKGVTPMSLAARQGAVDMVACLLRYKVDINQSQALFFAAFCIHSRAAMNLLLEQGADINHPDSQGVTPLFAAISASSLANVQFLLDHGADVSLHPPGRTVLQHAFANWGTIEALPEKKRAANASEDAKQIISILGGFDRVDKQRL